MSLLRHIFPSFDGPAQSSPYVHTSSPKRRTLWWLVAAFAIGLLSNLALGTLGSLRISGSGATVPYTVTVPYAATAKNGDFNIGAPSAAGRRDDAAPERKGTAANQTTGGTFESAFAAAGESAAATDKASGGLKVSAPRPLRVIPTLGTVPPVAASPQNEQQDSAEVNGNDSRTASSVPTPPRPTVTAPTSAALSVAAPRRITGAAPAASVLAGAAPDSAAPPRVTAAAPTVAVLAGAPNVATRIASAEPTVPAPTDAAATVASPTFTTPPRATAAAPTLAPPTAAAPKVAASPVAARPRVAVAAPTPAEPAVAGRPRFAVAAPTPAQPPVPTRPRVAAAAPTPAEPADSTVAGAPDPAESADSMAEAPTPAEPAISPVLRATAAAPTVKEPATSPRVIAAAPGGPTPGAAPAGASAQRDRIAAKVAEVATTVAQGPASGQAAPAAAAVAAPKGGARPPFAAASADQRLPVGKSSDQARLASRQPARAKSSPERGDTLVAAYDYLTPDGRRVTVYRRLHAHDVPDRDDDDDYSSARAYGPPHRGFLGMFSRGDYDADNRW